LIFITLLLLTHVHGLVPTTTCGSLTPAKWFNLSTNDQVTLEYAVPALNSENPIPYLYGCRPISASSGSENITFTYNAQGFISYWRHYPEAIHNLTYFQSQQSPSDYYIFSAKYTSNSVLALSTRYDANGRIVNVETDQVSRSTHRLLYPSLQKPTYESFLRRSIQVPVGEVNYYYNTTNPSLASSVAIGWHGINQVTYTYGYASSGTKLSNQNITIQLMEDSPYTVNYQYYYDTNGVLTYYCVNSCSETKISFYYDTKGRFTLSSVGSVTVVSLNYDNNGNINTVQTGDGQIWQLVYA